MSCNDTSIAYSTIMNMSNLSKYIQIENILIMFIVTNC